MRVTHFFTSNPPAKLANMGYSSAPFRARPGFVRRVSAVLVALSLGGASLGASLRVPPANAMNLPNSSTTSITIHSDFPHKSTYKSPDENQIVITQMPPILGPDTPGLRLKARVDLVENKNLFVNVDVKIGTRTPVTRQELADWILGKTRAKNLKTVATLSYAELKPNRTNELELWVPRENLPLGRATQWGPRFLELTVVPKPAPPVIGGILGTDSTGENQTGSQSPGNNPRAAGKKTPASTPTTEKLPTQFSTRSFLLWDSGDVFEPSQMLALVPVVATGRDTVTSGEILPDFATSPAARQQKICELARKAPLTPVFDPLLMNRDSKAWQYARRLLQLKTTTKPDKNDNHVNTKTPDFQADATTNPTASSAALAEELAGGQCGKMAPAYLPPGDFAAANTSWLNSQALANSRRRFQPGTRPGSTRGLHTTSNRQLLQAATTLAQKLDSQPQLAGWRENLILWPNINHRNYNPEPDYLAEVEAWGTLAPLVVESDREYQETPKPLTHQTDARHEIQLTDDTTTLGWTADQELSNLLDGDAIRLGFNLPHNTEASPITLRQWALATTAVLTRERPFAPRLFVAAAARDYAASPQQAAVIEGLAGARWLQFPNWREVRPDNRGRIKLAPQSVVREKDFSTRKSGAPANQIIYSNPALALSENLVKAAAVVPTLGKGQEFQEIFTELQVRSMCATCENTFPDGKLSPGNFPVKTGKPLGANSAGDSAWQLMHPRTSSPPTPLALIDPDISLRLLNLVNAQPASVINLIDEQAKIPISVTNNYDSPVTLRVRLKATDARLQFQTSPKLQIPAYSTAQTHVPVRAVGHGDISVRVSLTNLKGQEVGSPEDIQVRVRAQWESTGVYVLAGILAIVLVGGIIRRIAKGRKHQREKHER